MKVIVGAYITIVPCSGPRSRSSDSEGAPDQASPESPISRPGGSIRAWSWDFDPMPQSDRSLAESLFDALRDSDGTALRALLPPLQGRLQVVAKQRLSESLAEDAVQETLATLWRKRDALESAGHVLPFIFQCPATRYPRIVHVRLLKRRARIPVEMR